MNDYHKLGSDSEIERDFKIRGPLTVAQFEEELLEWKRRVQKLSRKPDEDIHFDIPKGFKKLKEGEEIYHFRSDDRSWAYLAGLEGYVKIRKNKVIDSFVIVLS